MKTVRIDYIPRYTYDDYVQWKGRWELIGGIPYAMTPLPVIEHQEVSRNILVQLSNLLDKCEKCKVLPPVDWKLDSETVLQPDILVVCGEVGGKYLTKVPVMIFEILSPSTAFKDRNVKYKIYEFQGVKYYIVVDINARVAEVFELRKDVYEKTKDVQNGVISFELDGCNVDFVFGNIWKI